MFIGKPHTLGIQQISRLLVFIAILLAHTVANGEEIDTINIRYSTKAADSIRISKDSTLMACADTVVSDSCKSYYRWHISTNLLYWIALAHNVSIEYDLDNKQSLSLGGACAWWSNLRKHHVYRWMVAEVAYRRYLNCASPHHGAFVGSYLQTGLFEMMFSSKNRKGEFLASGISGGYSWNAADHWSLTAEMGVGYMAAKYRYATGIDHTLIHQGNNHWRYFGPTRIALSLTYNFIKNRRNK